MKKVFCENCRSDVTYTTRPAHLIGRIKDKEYHYEGLEAICDDCGAFVYVPEINDSNLDELYRVRNQVSEDSEVIADFPGRFYVDEDDRIIGEYGVDFTPYLVDALNHPEHIIRNPKLSENELAIINAFPEVGKIRNDAALVVHLYDKNDRSIATIDASLFPSLPKNYVIEDWDEWQNDN